MVRPMTPSRETWERHLRETEREGQSRRIRCRICSRRFRLIPRMINNSSIRRNGGFFFRYSTILCAVASPIPGRVVSSAIVARLTLICAGGRAPAFVWVRFWGSFPLSHTPELGTDNTKKRPTDIAATRMISCCDLDLLRCLSSTLVLDFSFRLQVPSHSANVVEALPADMKHQIGVPENRNPS